MLTYEYTFLSYWVPHLPEPYITVQEVAQKWGITPRQVQILCKENRIDGAMRMSRIWIILGNAGKPTRDSVTRVRKNNDE